MEGGLEQPGLETNADRSPGEASMEDPRLLAQAMVRNDPACIDDLWLQYWANGGDTRRAEFDDHLSTSDPWDAFELKVLAWAIEDLAGQLS